MKGMRAVPIGAGTVQIDTSSIPAHVGQNIAQAALRAIQRDYANPEVQADYLRWKAARAANKKRKEEGT